MGRALNLRSVLSSIDQFTRNSGVARDQLTVTSSALDNVVSSLQELRRLALSGGSASLTDEARTSIAAQVRSVGETMASTGNTRHMGKYIFSGSLSDTQPIIENAGVPPYLYQGNDDKLNVRIGMGMYATANVTADRIFNIGGVAVPTSPDVFTVVEEVATAVQNGDVSGLSSLLTDIDANLNNAIAVRSQVGEQLQRLESTETALADAKMSTTELLSQTEDADLAEALIALSTRQNVYQAAISTASRLLSISLSDFLQ
jgi:flagellar hook-associated protein 3 FlgL